MIEQIILILIALISLGVFLVVVYGLIHLFVFEKFILPKRWKIYCEENPLEIDLDQHDMGFKYMKLSKELRRRRNFRRENRCWVDRFLDRVAI